MNRITGQVLMGINQSVIKFRGIYSLWSKKHGISYNEMLVLYTIHYDGFCTQKKICDSYLLPKQTVHNVMRSMIEKGYLCENEKYSFGREKAYVFTESGNKYAHPFLKSLCQIEEKSVGIIGIKKIEQITKHLEEYYEVLNMALCEEE